VFKLYDEEGEIDAPQRLAAAGVLLFQDLALVPMMLLVPVLSGPGERAVQAAATALLAGVAALAVLLVLARAVLPRLLALVAQARTPELFPLAALVIAFGTALAAARLGLSLPIGAFLAGLALSGSPYAHQVFAELLPLRDAFVAIFFTSMGMLLDPAVVAEALALLAGLVGLVLFKGLLIAVIVGLLWRSAQLAVLVGMALAQIGEFSFVLAREGVAAGIIAPPVEQAFLGAAVLTMAATPFLVRGARRLAALGSGRSSTETPAALRDHVLVIGYGITGQAVARVLRETGIPFAAVDMVPDAVEAGRREGIPVRFGDASRRGVLEEMAAEAARAAVVAVVDPGATRRIVSLLRQLNGNARILVRARRVGEIEELERLGADEALPSEFEVSIELFVRLLTHLGVPRHVVRYRSR
jgi:CPA2 family monovalent cation:H+ antiporter-2